MSRTTRVHIGTKFGRQLRNAVIRRKFPVNAEELAEIAAKGYFDFLMSDEEFKLYHRRANQLAIPLEAYLRKVLVESLSP
jgi:hypothetical protein